MRRFPAYFALADWFEYLNADCDYEKWSQYLHNELLSLGVRAGAGLVTVACPDDVVDVVQTLCPCATCAHEKLK